MALPAILAALPIVSQIADGIQSAISPQPAKPPVAEPPKDCRAEVAAAQKSAVRRQAQAVQRATSQARKGRLVAGAAGAALGLVLGLVLGRR